MDPDMSGFVQPTGARMNSPKQSSVSERALFARVQRALFRQQQCHLRRSREGSKLAWNLGCYYAIDGQRYLVARTHIDLAMVARELGVLQSHERLSDG